MRILLDESLPHRLRAAFPRHEVATVAEVGWSGLQNGELLRLAPARFDLFVTADQNLQYQQNLSSLPLSIAVLAGLKSPKASLAKVRDRDNPPWSEAMLGPPILRRG